MALDFVIVECPFCHGDMKLYDGEREAACESCDTVIEVEPDCDTAIEIDPEEPEPEPKVVTPGD